MNLIDEALLDNKWEEVISSFKRLFGKTPKDVNAFLFVIGVQELGKGFQRFTKEEKQDLMHIAICRLLSLSGYYVFDKIDEDGWPHYELVKPLPYQKIGEQEKYLKRHIIAYFKEQDLI